jgi:hypothetical protein
VRTYVGIGQCLYFHVVGSRDGTAE